MTKRKPGPKIQPAIELTPKLLELATKLKDPRLAKTTRKFEEVFRKPPTQSELIQYAKWVLSASFEWTAEDSAILKKMDFDQSVASISTLKVVQDKLRTVRENNELADEARV
jgi:hypothetical protein